MVKRQKTKVQPSGLVTVPRMESNGFEILAGDIIKISGEYGARFKFVGVTTNEKTGATWVDCFEIIGTVPSVFRSFKEDRVKRIPKKKRRAKRVG
jgi:hypothetical protein